jgi:hypothetical protein
MKKIVLFRNKNPEDREKTKLKSNKYPRHPLYDKHAAFPFS